MFAPSTLPFYSGQCSLGSELLGGFLTEKIEMFAPSFPKELSVMLFTLFIIRKDPELPRILFKASRVKLRFLFPFPIFPIKTDSTSPRRETSNNRPSLTYLRAFIPFFFPSNGSLDVLFFSKVDLE